VTDSELEEYRSLRATIRQRGSVRLCVFVGGLAAWAAGALACTLINVPLVTVIPLLVLAGSFEAVFSLHIGVERVGRYLQVFHGDTWEESAMAFGQPSGAARTDPLFLSFFALATMCNFVPVLIAGAVPIELAVLGGVHALFLLRLVVARQASARQRAVDLERFRQLKSAEARKTP
jgi:hypothetical protein